MGSWCNVEDRGVTVRAWFHNNFETYHIGDVLKWEPSFLSPGEWINGFHQAELEGDEHQQFWVVIKDFKITRNGRSWEVAAAYDDQAPLFANVFILVSFDKSVTIGSESGE